MKTKNEIATYVGDRLLVEEVPNIDYIQRDDEWWFEIVLPDYSVIALCEGEFDQLFTQGRVSKALFAKTLMERVAAKLGQASKRMEDQGRVDMAMACLVAAKDDEQLFGRLLSNFTGGKITA